MSDPSPSLVQLAAIIGEVSGIPITAVDANLIDLGVNSISMLVAVGTIESEFGIEFHADDLTRANFNSVRSIFGLIRRMQAARAAATTDQAHCRLTSN
jgi:acyl carrier protein